MHAPQPFDLRRQLACRAALIFAIGVTHAGAARAQTQAEAHNQARPAARVEWNDSWARFRPWEYAATGAAWTQALFVRLVGPGPNPVRGTFWLDEQITNGFSVSAAKTEAAAMFSDIGYRGSIAYRLLDSTVVPGLVWGSSDVALQMTMIDLEAFAIGAVVLWNAQLVYGRERPIYRDCPNSAPEGVDCSIQDADRDRTFIAGHTLVTTTAAALTCVHHSHLPLYGGGAADDLACAGMIGLAAAVGLSRIAAGQHYASDTLLAWGIGVVAGYIVPSALHYGFGRTPRVAATARRRPANSTVRLTVVPGVETSVTGATLAGTF